MTDTDEIPTRPPTIAQLPFFASGRYPKPDLLGRCEGDGVVLTSGRELLERVREIGLGLQSIGLNTGDRVILLAESRPEWLLVDFAIVASGGVTVPVYPSQSAEQVAFIVRDSGATVAVVSTREQLDKLRARADSLPDLRHVVVTQLAREALTGLPATASMLPPSPPAWKIDTLDEIAERGHQALRDGWGVAREFQVRAKSIRPGDLATIVYTSGTTGEPKGVMLTHGNLVANIEGLIERFEVGQDDVGLSFLPLCHGFERMIAYVYMTTGMSMMFAESLETVARDIQRVRPTIMTGVPRVYEKLHERIAGKAHETGGLTHRAFNWASRVALARADIIAADRKPSPWLAAQVALADRLVFRKIREGLGGRFRFAVSGGAPLGDAIERWFLGIGLPLIEGYGLTETSPVLTAMPLHGMRFGTVGPALRNVEIRIADDGEVLARGPNVMTAYFHRPEATAAAFKDGWFCTGDIGQLDDQGYLRITDRKKELIVTSGGKKIAPQPIETELRHHPLIAEAVLIGDKRRFPAVLIVPHFATLSAQLGVPRPADDVATAVLLARPETQALFLDAIETVNARLAQFERVKAFRLLPREFTQDTGELTPTLKVKRRVINDKYKSEIESMYAGS
jgi:long-chain acyl-CoA synthetase